MKAITNAALAVHLDETATMVGRALTATFVPKRADLDNALTEKGHAAGHIGGRKERTW